MIHSPRRIMITLTRLRSIFIVAAFAQLLIFNGGLVYYYISYTDLPGGNNNIPHSQNDDVLTHNQPHNANSGGIKTILPIINTSSAIVDRRNIPKCLDGIQKCKWWPFLNITSNDIKCIYSSNYPQEAIEHNALFDTEAACCDKHCVKKHDQKQQGRTPYTMMDELISRRISHGLDFTVEIKLELRNALMAGRSSGDNALDNTSSEQQAEQCNHLLQERAEKQQEYDNLLNERKRNVHGSQHIKAALQTLELELNAADMKIGSFNNFNCSYTQLILHRLGDGRLINDPTLFWNKTMYRPWLDPNLSEDKRPPYMLLLTTVGWNQRSLLEGLKFARHKFETEFYTALVNHPYFHPTAWDDIESGKLDIMQHGVNYYVFPDLAQSKSKYTSQQLCTKFYVQTH